MNDIFERKRVYLVIDLASFLYACPFYISTRLFVDWIDKREKKEE